ncbi:MAG: hypothetical protein FWH32_01430 [Clostridiales bacterium]|nr:hypothetical protein [Clostridiales bacterium]
MNKKRSLRIIAIGIVIAVFNVVVFAPDFRHTSTFWLAYVFGMVALASQILVWIVGWDRASALKSKVLGIPILQIGMVYLIGQMVLSLVLIAGTPVEAAFKALLSGTPLDEVLNLFLSGTSLHEALVTLLPGIPWEAALIACVAWLAICALLMIGAEVGRDAIEGMDRRVGAKVMYIRALQSEAEQMAAATTDETLKGQLAGLAESIRYSDPMSDPSLEQIEVRMIGLLGQIKAKCEVGDTEGAAPLVTEAKALLNERNVKTRLLK